MSSFLALHAIAAGRGEGLLPQLVEALRHQEATDAYGHAPLANSPCVRVDPLSPVLAGMTSRGALPARSRPHGGRPAGL
ncbi:hypothetical protein [Rhizobium sp. Root1203]|uniref:hypothetical protein n=1 Tax=Rhizobium sp. Root1203 TaxID=1736427 RepID=UPI000A8D0EB7|nr:hypothetical protein [Rhizobium sp. Root1203]